MNELVETAQAFVAYYKGNGGCSNCGGLPHSSTCFVGRFEQALQAYDKLRKHGKVRGVDVRALRCAACGVHSVLPDYVLREFWCLSCGVRAAREGADADRTQKRP